MNERELLMRKIATVDFALTDLHLFLNTHPDNINIAHKLEEYQAKSRELKKEYAYRFGPLAPSAEDGNRWAWIANPWPWDSPLEEEC